jgi:hypothetical protein
LGPPRGSSPLLFQVTTVLGRVLCLTSITSPVVRAGAFFHWSTTTDSNRLLYCSAVRQSCQVDWINPYFSRAREHDFHAPCQTSYIDRVAQRALQTVSVFVTTTQPNIKTIQRHTGAEANARGVSGLWPALTFWHS